jgi:hypothetical protein
MGASDHDRGGGDAVFSLRVEHACTLGEGTGKTWMLTGPFSGHIPPVDTALVLVSARAAQTTLLGSVIGAPRGLASIKVLPIWGADPRAYVGAVVNVGRLLQPSKAL